MFGLEAGGGGEEWDEAFEVVSREMKGDGGQRLRKREGKF